jgi:amylosucrase
MQAHSFFLGGLPMLFYGDEVGYTNDYSYLQDPGKSYDNRWMHRPIINWQKNKRINTPDSIEYTIFHSTQKLIQLRKKLEVISDKSNLTWLTPHTIHVAGYMRVDQHKKIYCIFNFSKETAYLTWYAFKETGTPSGTVFDHWTEKEFQIGEDHEHLIIAPYGFHILEPIA